MTLFAVAAVAGFKGSPWIVVAALAGQGVQNAVHSHILANAGVPAWPPALYLAYDVGAAAALAWILTRVQTRRGSLSRLQHEEAERRYCHLRRVEVLDFAGPFDVFSGTRLGVGVESRRSDASAPFNVFTVARSMDTVDATGALRVLPHFDFVGAPPIDLVVIPGAFGTRQLLDDLEVREWIPKSRQQGAVDDVRLHGRVVAREGWPTGGKRCHDAFGRARSSCEAQFVSRCRATLARR